jgi:Flp pilus assembly pilin Flp
LESSRFDEIRAFCKTPFSETRIKTESDGTRIRIEARTPFYLASPTSVLEFFSREDGAAAIEYALIASLIVIAMAIGVQSVGTQLFLARIMEDIINVLRGYSRQWRAQHHAARRSFGGKSTINTA